LVKIRNGLGEGKKTKGHEAYGGEGKEEVGQNRRRGKVRKEKPLTVPRERKSPEWFLLKVGRRGHH